MQLLSVWFREACLIKTTLQTAHQPGRLSKTWDCSYNPENTRSLNTGHWCPLVPRTVGGLSFRPADFCGCHHFLSCESTEHLLIANEDLVFNYSNEIFFLLTSRYRDKSCFQHDREIRLSLLLCGDPSSSQTLAGQIQQGMEQWHPLCIVFHCWMRQHWTVWLAGMNTGSCGKATDMLTSWSDNLWLSPCPQPRLRVWAHLQAWRHTTCQCHCLTIIGVVTCSTLFSLLFAISHHWQIDNKTELFVCLARLYSLDLVIIQIRVA